MKSLFGGKKKDNQPVTIHTGNLAYLSIKDKPEQSVEKNEFVTQLNELKNEIQRKAALYQADEKADNLLERAMGQYTTRLHGIRQEIELALQNPVDASTVANFQHDITEADQTLLEAAQNAFYNMLATIIMNFPLWKKEQNQYVGGVGFTITEDNKKKTVRLPAAIATIAEQHLKMEGSAQFKTEQLIKTAQKAAEKGGKEESMQFCQFLGSLDKLTPAGMRVKMNELKSRHPNWLGESAPQVAPAPAKQRLSK